MVVVVVGIVVVMFTITMIMTTDLSSTLVMKTGEGFVTTVE